MIHLKFLIFKSQTYVSIDDTLTLEFLYKHLLKISDLLFDINININIPNIYFSGLNLSHVHSRFDLQNFYYLFLPSYYAYQINSIVVRIIGYFSFKYLLKILPAKEKDDFLIFLLSISFSLIPINTIYGITILGLPLVLIGIIKLQENQNIKGITILSFYVFYSTPLTIPFIICYLILCFFLPFIKIQKKNILIGIIILATMFLIKEHGIILSNLIEKSHRILRIESINYPTLNGIIYGLFKYSFLGKYHPSLMITLPVFLLLFILREKLTKYVLIILMFYFINNLIDLIRPFFEALLGPELKVLTTFDIGRVNWLNPFLIMLALSLTVLKLNKGEYKRKTIIFLILIQTCLNILRNHEFSLNYFNKEHVSKFLFNDDFFVKNMKNFRNKPFDILSKSSLNYDEYFSITLFKKLDDYINLEKNKYRIINFGLDPNVTLYNGFFTIDGETSSHSLRYHKIFDKIDTNNDLGGSHSLILKNKYCFNCDKSKYTSSYDVNYLNFNLLKKLNCKFIFSTINFKKNPHIKFLKSFENKTYKIYLYEII